MLQEQGVPVTGLVMDYVLFYFFIFIFRWITYLDPIAWWSSHGDDRVTWEKAKKEYTTRNRSLKMTMHILKLAQWIPKNYRKLL